jgi:DNA-binding winged helix-turn-helix (wHTH) protein
MRRTFQPTIYRFGPFTFDAGRGVLRRGATRVPLAAQPARALGVLVARAGEVVTREELRQALWGDRAVEAETGLNFCLHQVRTALGDEARQPTYIATVQGAGYRFVAPVRVGAGRGPAWWIAGGAAAAALLLAFAVSGAVPDDNMRAVAADVTADPAVPTAVVEAVASRVDTVAASWRPAGVPITHRVLVHGVPADTGNAVQWEFRLVDRGARVLASGHIATSGLDPGAEAPWVAEAVGGLVTSWRDRSDASVQRYTRVVGPK